MADVGLSEVTTSTTTEEDRARQVKCFGNALCFLYVDLPSDVVIDTRQAGPGELTVFCDAPDSDKPAACQRTDHVSNGQSVLTITAHTAGLHSLHVRYNDVNVPGSPFPIWASSASLIKVTGPGVEHGVLSTFKSVFEVDATEAGPGDLRVRVGGRRGTFKVQTKAVGRRVRCFYNVTEPGDYSVEVTWSGDPVPQSPFSVLVFSSEEELDAYVAATSIATNSDGSSSTVSRASSCCIQ